MTVSENQLVNNSFTFLTNASYTLIGRPLINGSMYFEINFTISASSQGTSSAGTAWFLPNGTATAVYFQQGAFAGQTIGGLIAGEQGTGILIPYFYQVMARPASGAMTSLEINQTTLNFGSVRIVQKDYNLTNSIISAAACQQPNEHYSAYILGIGQVPGTNFQICTYAYEAITASGTSDAFTLRVLSFTEVS